jgi:WD40 repeat protein
LTVFYYHLLYQPKKLNNNIVKLEKVFTAHTADIWTVKFSPAENIVASGGVDSTVKIWKRESGEIIHTLKHPMGVTYLAFRADGKFIATSCYDGKVRIWKVEDGSLIKEFAGHEGTVWHVAFSTDGRTIASGGQDATIKLWDVEKGILLRILKGHKLTVWSVKFSPDGNIIASGSFDNTVKLWNVLDGKLLSNIKGHTEAVVDLAFSNNGKKLATASDDKTIKIWDMPDGKIIHSIKVPEHVQAVVFSPDDKRLMTGGRDKIMIGEFLQEIFGDSKFNKGISARLWDVKDGTLLQTFAEHSNDVNDIAYSIDGKYIATASSDKTVQIWKLLK